MINLINQPITIQSLRLLGFNPIKGARKMSYRGKNFSYVVENVHMRGDKFEFQLTLPVVKRIQTIDQLQSIFHALEGYELDAQSLVDSLNQ